MYSVLIFLIFLTSQVPYLLQVEVLETDMSVEEIRAQRRDLDENDEDSRPSEENPIQEVLINDNGSVQVEDALATNGHTSGENSQDDTAPTSPSTLASPTTIGEAASGAEGEKKKSSVEIVPHPPVGSLADLTISPPGSPVPSSPVVSSARLRSPAPSHSSGPHRAPTHSHSNEAYLQTVLKRRASNSADDFAEKMRTAAVMLAQLSQQQAAQQAGAGANGTSRTSAQSRSSIKAKATSVEDIRAKIIKEMMALEEQRMQRMKIEGVSSGVGGGGGEGAGSEMLEDERKVMANVATDDPSGEDCYVNET